MSGITLGEIRERFLLEGRARGLSGHTLASAERMLRFFIDSEYGVGPGVDPWNLSEDRVLEYLVDRKEKGSRGRGLMYSSHNSEFRLVKRFLKWAHKRGHTPVQLLQNTKPPRPDVRVIDPLTTDEIIRIFKSVRRSPQMTALVGLLLECGLRRGEVAGLELEHVDLENRTVRVLGKRRKWRVVPFGDTQKKLFLRHLGWREMALPETDAFFIGRNGEPLTGPKIQVRIQTIRKRTGIDRLSGHLFRITYANEFLRRGGDAFLLRANLGHEGFRSVAGYIRYAGTSNYDLSRKVSLLDTGDRISSLDRVLRSS